MKKKAILFSAGDYYDSINFPKPSIDLPGVKYDISAIETRLKQIGFDVMMKENIVRSEFIPTLQQSAKGSPSDAVHIVYFTGHGGHHNGENYIYPVDFTEQYDFSNSLENSGINIKEIIQVFKGKGRLILILDACRKEFYTADNYFSEMAISKDVYIAYGTMFQESAIGLKDGLSWFTEAICDEILAPDIDVDLLFTRVRQNIYTKHSVQIPSSVNALLKKVILHKQLNYDYVDKELYDFISKYSNYYNGKHGYFEGEYLLFIDAAQYFNISLLDAYWRYTKVQNKLAVQQGINMPLLNEVEQKIVTFNILKNSGYFTYDEIHTWYYGGRQIRMGEIPPCPMSMQVLPPEVGKEINVDIDAQVIITDKRYVVCKGTTTLPPNTHLMINLYSDTLKYYATSNITVDLNGQFASEEFSYKKKGLPHGNYIIKINVPIASVQSDDVKILFGDKGRNLVGKYVQKDIICGKTVEYKMSVDLL